MDEKSFEKLARQRVSDIPELHAWYDTIFYDWSNWEDHMRWIATAPVDEIVGWAETVEDNNYHYPGGAVIPAEEYNKMNNWYISHAGNLDHNPLIVDEETGKDVALVYVRGSSEEAEKQAALIAAAPELYSTLMALLEDVEFAQPQIEGGLIGNRQIRKARAAIAKAEGK